jgi:putative transposase
VAWCPGYRRNVIRSRIPTLWTNSYFVATVGGATLEIVEQYVADQRNV